VQFLKEWIVNHNWNVNAKRKWFWEVNGREYKNSIWKIGYCTQHHIWEGEIRIRRVQGIQAEVR